MGRFLLEVARFTIVLTAAYVTISVIDDVLERRRLKKYRAVVDEADAALKDKNKTK